MHIPTRGGYLNRYKLAGFGLIEILITIVVIGVGLLTIAGLYSRTMSASVVSKQRSEAVVIAESMLEQLRGTVYANIVSGYDSIAAVSGSGSSAAYQRSWTVTSNTNPAYRDVAMTVTWSDSQGATQTVSLVTRINGIGSTPITVP